MTLPLSPRKRPGRSEFSHGPGYMPHPDSDYQSQRVGIPGVLSAGSLASGETYPGTYEDKKDIQGRLIAERRSDPTNSEESVYPDLLYAQGNPDIYGPGPALVQEGPFHPPVAYKQPTYRTGVDRQG